MLSELLGKSKEDTKKIIDGLSDGDKMSLFKEIDEKTKSAQEEYIRLETTKKKLEEDEAAQLEKLKSMGINSYEELEANIKTLEEELNSKLEEYIEALKGE